MVLAATLAAGACTVQSGSTIHTEDIEAQEPALVTEGEALYLAECAGCHGADLRGSDEGPSLLSDIYEPGHHADFAFVRAIQHGASQHHWTFGRMEPIEHLGEDEIDAIIAYVREVQRIEGYEPYPP